MLRTPQEILRKTMQMVRQLERLTAHGCTIILHTDEAQGGSIVIGSTLNNRRELRALLMRVIVESLEADGYKDAKGPELAAVAMDDFLSIYGVPEGAANKNYQA